MSQKIEKAISEDLAARIAHHGFGTVVKVLEVFTIRHTGWELDNMAWFVETTKHPKLPVTTNHGGFCIWRKAEALETMADAKAEYDALVKAVNEWPEE